MKKIISHIKGKARCRKGVGMELALMVLLIVTACSLLMVSTALVARDGLLNRGERVTSRLLLDQLAEYTIKGTQDSLEEEDSRFSGYVVYKKGEADPVFGTNTDITAPELTGTQILIITDTEGKILLTVETIDGTNTGKITGWIYG